VDTKKSPRQDATIEELAKLTFHKPRNVPVAFTLTAKERFQVPGDDSIHRIVFWIARPVRGIGSHEGIASRKAARKSLPNSLSHIRDRRWAKIRLSHDNPVAFVACLPILFGSMSRNVLSREGHTAGPNAFL